MIVLLNSCHVDNLFGNAGQAVAERSLIRALVETGEVRMRLVVHGEGRRERLERYFADLLADGCLELIWLVDGTGEDWLAGVDSCMLHGVPANLEWFYRLAIANRLPVMVHVYSLELASLDRVSYTLCWQLWDRHLPARLVCPSMSAAQRLMDLSSLPGMLGVSLPPIEVIPLGIGPEAFRRGSRKQGRQLLGCPSRARLLLSLNRLSPDKLDHPQLLHAFAHLCATHPQRRPLHLALVGGMAPQDAAYVDSLRLQAERLGLSARLSIVPHLHDDAKHHVLAAADVFVSTASNPQESFGIVLLEAMAAGLPIVATDWDGYREVLPAEYYPWLVPTVASHDLARALEWGGLQGGLSDATAASFSHLVDLLDRFLSGGREVNQLVAAGRARARKFTWATTARALVALWKSMLGGTADRRPAVDLGLRPLFSPVAGLATRHLDESVVLQATGGGRRLPDQEPGTQPWPAGDASLLRAVLAACEVRSTSLPELRAAVPVDVPVLDWCVLYLLRYGMLELAGGEMPIARPAADSHRCDESGGEVEE